MQFLEQRKLDVMIAAMTDIIRGDASCIVAPSGPGKSTSKGSVNASTPIDQGSVTVACQEGHDPKLVKRELRAKVGMVFQQYNLYPQKTALQNVMMAPTILPKRDARAAEERASKLLEKIRLRGKEQSHPGARSGGQQQRVHIARSLAMSQDFMLFDEGTAAPYPPQELLRNATDPRTRKFPSPIL